MTRKAKEKVKESVSEVDCEVWCDITYVCPVRGTVTERVKGVRYKPQKAPHLPIHELEFLKDDSNEDIPADE